METINEMSWTGKPNNNHIMYYVYSCIFNMYNLETYLFLKPSASLLFLSIDFLSSKNWFLLKANTIFKENVDQGEILHTRANILHFYSFYIFF